MELSDKKFAVLIDADNISHRKIKDILDEIANYGTPTIKRIYGDFTDPKFAAWKSILLENSITPIQQYAYTTGKNATDSALIIDAMDILHKESVNGFERQRLYASGKPHPRIGPRGAGLRRKENAETVHQILRQIHLRRDSRTACRSDAGTCACTGSRSGCDTDTGSESRTKKDIRQKASDV